MTIELETDRERQAVETRLKVLVIDDDEGQLRLAQRRLSKLGFDIEGYASAAEGLARLQDGTRFDAVALDHYLPGIDGLQVLARIRTLAEPPPVVYVTALDEARLAVAALKAGAADYVVKTPDLAYYDLLAAALRQAVIREEERRARIRAEETREILLQELSHRVKNVMAVLQSVAELSARRAGTLEEFLAAFRARVGALVAAHQLLVDSGWQNVRLPDLARAVLEPQLDDRLTLEAEAVSIDPSMANMLALVLHELATNALKYGALSAPTGRITVVARMASDGGAEPCDGGEPRGGSEPRLHLEWRERGGPPPQEPEHEGFGLAMIRRVVARQHNGDVRIDWRPEGLEVWLSFPLVTARKAPLARS